MTVCSVCTTLSHSLLPQLMRVSYGLVPPYKQRQQEQTFDHMVDREKQISHQMNTEGTHHCKQMLREREREEKKKDRVAFDDYMYLHILLFSRSSKQVITSPSCQT